MILQMDLNTANDSLADFESRGRVTARAYEALDALRSDSAIITKIKAPGSLFCNINTLVALTGASSKFSALVRRLAKLAPRLLEAPTPAVSSRVTRQIQRRLSDTQTLELVSSYLDGTQIF
jgi:hypothetical protein